MKTMTRILLSVSVLALAACPGDDEGDDDNMGTIDAAPTPDAPPTPDAGPPGKPTPGAQIERMGRPAINTALIAPFQGDAAMRGTARDAYNANGDKSTWVAMHAAEIKNNLAILDSLDTVCGNQFGADANPMARYSVLAGALADDQLYVKSDSPNCTTYLAVEGNALGLANTDCGGRKLQYDVVETSYSVLAAGTLSGIDDGIDYTGVSPAPGFPYLGPPTTPP